MAVHTIKLLLLLRRHTPAAPHDLEPAHQPCPSFQVSLLSGYSMALRANKLLLLLLLLLLRCNTPGSTP
jgi:hypothetical protein